MWSSTSPTNPLRRRDRNRAIGATCGGVRMWSLYVPNGREPDHEHYAYKLRWLAALKATAEVSWQRILTCRTP